MPVQRFQRVAELNRRIAWESRSSRCMVPKIWMLNRDASLPIGQTAGNSTRQPRVYLAVCKGGSGPQRTATPPQQWYVCSCREKKVLCRACTKTCILVPRDCACLIETAQQRHVMIRTIDCDGFLPKMFWIGLVVSPLLLLGLLPTFQPPREPVPQPFSCTSAIESVQQGRNLQASCTASHGLTRKEVRFGRKEKGFAYDGATLPRHCEPLFTPAAEPHTITF